MNDILIIRKIFVTIVLVCLTISSSSAFVCNPDATAPKMSESCKEYAEQQYKDVKNDIKNKYQETYRNMRDVKNEYDNLAQKLKISNEKLETMINVAKNKLLQEKKIVFLLRQHNQLLATEADIRAEELSDVVDNNILNTIIKEKQK